MLRVLNTEIQITLPSVLCNICTDLVVTGVSGCFEAHLGDLMHYVASLCPLPATVPKSTASLLKELADHGWLAAAEVV